MDTPTQPSMGEQFVRTAWIFQALCAFPTLLIMGTMAFEQLFYPYVKLYEFM
jgi:hypothetical protein